jgi:hypothetical protein
MTLGGILLTLILILPLYTSAEIESNDANQSKLFVIGETGTICEKGTGYAKLGINMILPTLNTAYAPFQNWEAEFLWIGLPTIKNEEKNEEKKTETGFNILRLGFKHHVLV